MYCIIFTGRVDPRVLQLHKNIWKQFTFFFFSPKIRVFIRYLLSIIYSGFCRKVLFAYTYKYEALSITRRFYLAILSFFFLSFFCYTNTIYTFILEFCKYKTFVNKRYFIIFNFLRFYTFLFTIFLIPFIQF